LLCSRQSGTTTLNVKKVLGKQCVHIGARAHITFQVTLRMQLLEGGDNGAAGNAVASCEFPSRRKPHAPPQTAVQDARAHLVVYPLEQGRSGLAFANYKIECGSPF